MTTAQERTLMAVVLSIFGLIFLGAQVCAHERNKVKRQDLMNWHDAVAARNDINNFARLGTVPAMKEASRRITEELQLRGTAVDENGRPFHQEWQVTRMKQLKEEITRRLEQESLRQE